MRRIESHSLIVRWCQVSVCQISCELSDYWVNILTNMAKYIITAVNKK